MYGGKDSSRVYFQIQLLIGLKSKSVLVYSKNENCSNCTGYFKDGPTVYLGAKKIMIHLFQFLLIISLSSKLHLIPSTMFYGKGKFR